MNQCTLEDKHSEVLCKCTELLKTASKLLVNKKESRPDVDVGDQDADDGKVRGKYKGMKLSAEPLREALIQLLFFSLSKGKNERVSSQRKFPNVSYQTVPILLSIPIEALPCFFLLKLSIPIFDCSLSKMGLWRDP